MSNDLDREDFTQALAARFVAVTDMTPGDARPYAEVVLSSYLESEGIAYGHDDYDWSTSGAQTIADEEHVVLGSGLMTGPRIRRLPRPKRFNGKVAADLREAAGVCLALIVVSIAAAVLRAVIL